MMQPHEEGSGRICMRLPRRALTRRTQVRRVALALASPVLLTVLVTACTATPVADSTSAADPAQRVCLQLSDVGTLVYNMMIARDADRIPGEEYQGAMYLAGSMLSRVQPSENPELNEAVEELKSAAGENAVNPDSDAWKSAFADVSDSCSDVLGEFGVRGWVGG